MKFEHAIHVIKCVLSDLVEVFETKTHKTRAMTILHFDFSKFPEKERKDVWHSAPDANEDHE